MNVFKNAHASGDSELMLLAELAYTALELEESAKSETEARSSTEAAVCYFEAAMELIPIVKDRTLYRIVNKSFSPHPRYRYKNFPKDAVHVACLSDRARIKNALRRIGIPEPDIILATERTAMLKAAQEAYCKLQQEALQIEG